MDRLGIVYQMFSFIDRILTSIEQTHHSFMLLPNKNCASSNILNKPSKQPFYISELVPQIPETYSL